MYDFSYLEYYKMQDNMLNLKIGICNGSTETENFIERMVCKKRKMSGITIQINIFSLKDLIRNNINECDIIFLDLKSEEDIARAVAAHNKSKQKKILIAIAADDGHAQELIELEVFRLLVKPLNEVMFDKYFYEALSKFPIISKVYNFQYNRIQYKILLNEIIYFQSDKRITYIITNNKINKIYSCYKSLNKVESEVLVLSNLFCRIHQSFLINVLYVKYFTEEIVELIDGTILGISRKRKKSTIEQLEKCNIPRQSK
ncbi:MULTISPECIES: LytR/AlgR family response regulator transcription factor [Lachnospiraceae]|jgi:DNA-binding LytR/AlgR family response regulator|uniref:LytR/AlgR family response regulator transcription factor n=1 Tax=Lachnospiraceae TaxID=186803 RepID=UPI0022DF996A|nr:LytTR family DNA-binding domain-containing protein [Coprococcus sp. AF51-11b1]